MGVLRSLRAAWSEPPQPPRPRPVGCPSCGRTFGSPSAHRVAHDDGRCLPDTMLSLLELVDGVYMLRGGGN